MAVPLLLRLRAPEQTLDRGQAPPGPAESPVGPKIGRCHGPPTITARSPATPPTPIRPAPTSAPPFTHPIPERRAMVCPHCVVLNDRLPPTHPSKLTHRASPPVRITQLKARCFSHTSQPTLPGLGENCFRPTRLTVCPQNPVTEGPENVPADAHPSPVYRSLGEFFPELLIAYVNAITFSPGTFMR